MAKIPIGGQLVWGPGYGVMVWERASNFHQICLWNFLYSKS